MLALDQTDKIWTKSCDPHTPKNLNYDNDDSIGWKMIPCASYKRLKSIYLMVHVACFRVKKQQTKWSYLQDNSLHLS